MDLNGAAMKLEQSLRKETEAFREFQLAEEGIKSALLQKDWTRLEQQILGLQIRAEELETLDGQRQQAWEGLRTAAGFSDTQVHFHAVVSALPSEIREGLFKARAEAKIAALGAKGLASGLEDYAQTTSRLIQGVLQEARPSLKGRLYSPRGMVRPSGAASLVLDRQF